MPFFVAATVMAAGLAWTVHLIVAPEPWATDSAMAIAIGAFVMSFGAMTALLLGRGRWTRFFAMGVVVAELLIATVGDYEGWLIAGIALSGLSLAGLGGPWFKGWLRERPAAGSPGGQPIALAIGAFLVVPLVGLASPDGLEAVHGVAGALGILFSWGYMKGGTWALLSLRFVMPLVLLGAAIDSPLLGTLALGLTAAVLAYLAWTPEARLAVDPLPELPSPRRRRSG